jgi:hypothetical protein
LGDFLLGANKGDGGLASSPPSITGSSDIAIRIFCFTEAAYRGIGLGFRTSPRSGFYACSALNRIPTGPTLLYSYGRCQRKSGLDFNQALIIEGKL